MLVGLHPGIEKIGRPIHTPSEATRVEKTIRHKILVPVRFRLRKNYLDQGVLHEERKLNKILFTWSETITMKWLQTV